MSSPTVSFPDYNDEPLAIVGVPSDFGSSYLPGCALAPAQVRHALYSHSANMTTELGADLGAPGALFDAGDLEVGADGGDFEAIEAGVSALLACGPRVLTIGGDHAVSHPILRAHVALNGPLDILHFDAHPDLYEDFNGNPKSHASPFARILEDGLARRLVQVGVRTMNAHQAEQVERYGVEVIEMREWVRTAQLEFKGPLYISFDMDVLDPSCAPGVSHWEPGGATTRQVLDLIHSIKAPIIGADVVELNPSRDHEGFTAMAAARVLREIAGKIYEGRLTNP